ncbi:hypothetical protein LTR78_003147 [Recurvomyces mirabilis]|uniref:Velvet domain-containing protein n=1 Tax=Recurvomyces mirabilis TaxID=574656 RepID=A0AAE0WS69_9PEZI|nr:hypothetical protein LTR78_003147 [Recurvomyces mirabilis]KAK5157032.1 hypothetical protein LTS14_004549 [Recurvomyces mirabilis]
MSESTSRSYARSTSGPRAVDSGTGRDKNRSSSKRQRSDNDDDKSSRRPSKDDHRSPKKDSSTPRRKQSSSRRSTETHVERPYFELDVIGQPRPGVPLADQPINAAAVDTSSLFAVASLVADNRSGERVPLEAGMMTGQKMFDSVHSIPEECADRLANNEPCRLVLGYVSFPDMLIRQSGTYRLRITLIKMSAAGSGGGSSILAVDSDPVKVERRQTAAAAAAPRKVQRVYS